MTEQANLSMESVRVLVVDDQQIIREGIATILGFQEGLEVIGIAANGRAAIEASARLQPDVILMDVRMPEMDGVEATTLVRRQLPACKILMLTTFDDEEYVIKAIRAGASGYLLKDIPGHELAQAIRAVHKGIYQLDGAVASRVFASLTAAAVPPTQQEALPAQPPNSGSSIGRKIDLTDRELEILRLIATGATNREIAQTLVITEGTVKNHVSNILSRLGLRDRTSAAIFARENGII